MRRSLFFLLFIIYAQFSMAHPYHHTLAIFDENTQTNQLELSFKMLSEDYAKINENQKVEDYVNSRLKISIGNQKLIGQYQGMEADVNYTWLYFLYDVDVIISEGFKGQKISVTNQLLTEINDKQVNTVKMNVSGQNTSYNFTTQNRRHDFIIE